jgi:hypothetical protein
MHRTLGLVQWDLFGRGMHEGGILEREFLYF